jgi:hypothetical protein
MTRALLALLLLAAHIGLAPLAHASPPDQTWIGGVYDDADYDDVVLLVTSLAGTVPATPPPPAVVLVVVAPLSGGDLATVPLAVRLVTPSRAPPAA